MEIYGHWGMFFCRRCIYFIQECILEVYEVLFTLYLLMIGVYIAARLRFFCFRHPIRCIRLLFSKRHDMQSADTDTYSPFRALTVALAGTLGVGNITGVAAAMLAGGPGALFWMWISALCTVSVKYAEVTLAVKTRIKYSAAAGKTEYRGGPMQYFSHVRGGSLAAAVFCVLCVAASLVQGNLIQTTAALSCLTSTFGLPLIPCTLLLCGIGAFLIFGGRKRISGFTSWMIPMMTAMYLVLGMTVILRNLSMLPAVFGEILRGAFSLRSTGVGGSIGCFLAMQHGCAKGVFSHEAGCGTAPISHAGAHTDDAGRQGLLGIVEVLVDTLLLCTVTGLVLLLSGTLKGTDTIGDGTVFTVCVLDAFSRWFGDGAAVLLSISIVFYAFATLICWSFYGSECVRTLLSRFGIRIQRIGIRGYLVVYAAVIFLGAFFAPSFLWGISDALTVSMTVCNTVMLLRLLPMVGLPWEPEIKTKKQCDAHRKAHFFHKIVKNRL